MKNSQLKNLSRKDLKNVFGGTLYPALECYSDRECSRYGEALIMCPDGSSSMTGYMCMGGTCIIYTDFCQPPVLEPFPEPILIP